MKVEKVESAVHYKVELTDRERKDLRDALYFAYLSGDVDDTLSTAILDFRKALAD